MNGIHFSDIKMLLLLWVIPLFLVLFLYAANRRKKDMSAFIEPYLLRKFSFSTSPKRGRRLILLCLAVALLVVSLARPAWNLREKTVERHGRDVVFMLDVSKSMLATDLQPNRFERAKLAIRDCIEKLQGDRVALVAFSGSASVKCPLTQDYSFFLMILESVNASSVNRGGTLLGDALRTAIDQVFDNQEKQFKDIILITDGEDHESFPVQAARAVGDAGIRLLVVGLGDEKEGQRIPILTAEGKQTFLQYNGQEVWTKLDGETLRRMAMSTPGGQYLPVKTGTIDLGQVYMDLIASADQKELASKTIKTYEEKYQFFLAAALLLLSIEGMIGRFVVIMPMLFFLGLSFPVQNLEASTRALINSGNQAYAEGKFPEAEKLYQDANIIEPDNPVASFNKGNSLYRQGKFSQAETAYEMAINSGKETLFLAESWFNKGNSRFQTANAKSDPQEQLNDLKESAAFFQKALQYQPQLPHAGRNLEITRKKIKAIEQTLQEQQQQQNSGEKQQNQETNGDQQQSQPEQNQDNEDSAQQQSPTLKDEQKQDQGENMQQEDQQKEEQEGPADKTETDDSQPQKSPGKQAQTVQPYTPSEENRGTIINQKVEDILHQEKLLQQMRMERMRISPDSVEKDW